MKWKCPACGGSNPPVMIVNTKPAIYLVSNDMVVGEQYNYPEVTRYLKCTECTKCWEICETPLSVDSWTRGNHLLKFSISDNEITPYRA